MAPLPESNSSRPVKSTAWPMAETMRSAGISCSVPSIILISSFGPTNLASHCATRSAVARPSAPRTTPTGAQPPRMSMPSARACSISCLLACILSTPNTEVSVTSAPWRAEISATSWAARPPMTFSAVGRLRVVDGAEAARHRGDVDRGVAAADHHHALADVLHAAVVEGAQEGGRGDHVGGVVAVAGQGPAALGAEAEEHRVELLADLFHGDVGADARLQLRLHAEVEDALDLGVEDVARRAEAGDAVAHHAAEELVLVEDRDVMAHARQLVGGGEAGRAAADDRHLLAGLRRGGGELQLVLDGVLAEEVLDGVDADVVLDLALRLQPVSQGAGQTRPITEGKGLASVRRRQAYSCHGIDRLAVGADRRLLDAAHDVQVAADVLAGGAAALAGRRRLDVGRALVGVAGLEDLLVPGHDACCRRPCSDGS
jgi:hypothetical protein